MLDILGLLCFIGFILMGLAVVWAQWAGQTEQVCQRVITAFVLYCLVASFGAGLTQRDAWPFSHWALASSRVLPTLQSSRLVAVDRAGREQAIDHRAWHPLSFDELILGWLPRRFPQLDHVAQERASSYLLHLVEQARTRARAGQGVGQLGRWLGPLTAPFFHLRPTLWSRPADVPPVPFIGLRLYEEWWNRQERRQDPEKFVRLLVYEYWQP